MDKSLTPCASTVFSESICYYTALNISFNGQPNLPVESKVLKIHIVNYKKEENKTAMPADVAMHTNFLQFNQSSLKDSNVDSCWNTENMSGYMTLVSPNGHRQGVQVKVYRTSVEHFAVIYPQKKVCRPLGVLNLRNTMIERYGDEGFLVRQKGFDSPVVLTFLMENKKELDYWIMAFTARTSPLVHQSSLPIVEEEDI